MDPYLGEIRPFAFDFAPRNWALCNGQILAIAQNQALFSLLGTTYGGNGVTTFALPDLRGRVAISSGQGPGLSSYSLGQAGGVENVTLSASEMPTHNHPLKVSNAAGVSTDPTNRVPAQAVPTVYNPTVNSQLNAATISVAGGSQPHPNMQPFVCVNYAISLTGIFPSRN